MKCWWCVDATGRCQAVTGQTRLDLRQRDHILYHPPTGDGPPRFAVYVSMHAPGAFLVHTGVGGSPTTSELADVYQWAIQHRGVYAYPCLRLDLLPHTPNESLATPEGVADWCDTQIDAFTRYQHKQHPGIKAPASTSSRRKRPLESTWSDSNNPPHRP